MHLPYGLMNDTRGKDLAGNLGEVVSLDVDSTGRAWGDYLRVRVSIKVLEPLMRCVSVFSQKRQMTEVFQVMYEGMPTFCFSCGLLGHSSTSCPTPGERDAEGLLPYHGPRFCFPDDRKKKMSGTRSGQSSFSSNHSDHGGGHNGQAAAPAKKGDSGTGEAISPKRKPRVGETPVVAKTDATVKNLKGKAGVAASGSNSQISGQKRKQVYRIKAKPNEGNVTPFELQLVSVPKEAVTAPIPVATEDGGNFSIADSNKKQKTSSPSSSNRSSDQEMTAEQRCRMQ
jgi:hypothetical protein